MSLSHKAFPFNWSGFEEELLPVLVPALDTGEQAHLTHFIEANRRYCTDPYEGEPLDDDWQDTLENGDVQELGDYALTKYYDVADDCGLHEDWEQAEKTLPPEVRWCLLGMNIGPERNRFDPGRMGAYFQTPDMVLRSVDSLAPLDYEPLNTFHNFLAETQAKGLGIYITF